MIRRLRERWNAVWFEQGPLSGLIAFRVLFAAALALDVSSSKSFAVYAIEGGFHLPYTRWVGPTTPEVFNALHAIQYPLIAAFAVGAFTRWAAALLFAIDAYVLLADQLDFRNHAYLFALILLLFAVIPCAPPWRAWGRLAWLERIRRMWGARGMLTLPRVIQAQVCIVYFYSGLHKLTDAYLHGRVLAGNFTTWLHDPPILALLPPSAASRFAAFGADPKNLVVPAVTTVLLELLLPVGLLLRRARPFAIAAGICFHAAVWATMNVQAFSLAMVASYVLFLGPKRSAAAGA